MGKWWDGKKQLEASSFFPQADKQMMDLVIRHLKLSHGFYLLDLFRGKGEVSFCICAAPAVSYSVRCYNLIIEHNFVYCHAKNVVYHLGGGIAVVTVDYVSF